MNYVRRSSSGEHLTLQSQTNDLLKADDLLQESLFLMVSGDERFYTTLEKMYKYLTNAGCHGDDLPSVQLRDESFYEILAHGYFQAAKALCVKALAEKSTGRDPETLLTVMKDCLAVSARLSDYVQRGY